jgi:hypothetical protein
MDDKALLSLRSRVVTLRTLDTAKIKDRTKWQLINIVGPIVAILLFGFFRLWSRRRTYGAPVVSTSSTPVMMDYVLSIIAALAFFMVFQSLEVALLTLVSAIFFFWNSRAASGLSRGCLACIAVLNIAFGGLFRDWVPGFSYTSLSSGIAMTIIAAIALYIVFRDSARARSKSAN